MNNRRRALMTLLTTGCFLITACENTASETIDNTNSQSTERSTIKNENKDPSNLPTKEQDNHQQKKQEGISNHTPSNSKGNDSQKSNSGGNEHQVSKKEDFQKKLQDTKNRADNLKPTDSSTYALKKVEDDKWGMWDALLNEIYGSLKDQLPEEEMDQLQEEQRRWIQVRDETALKASQKYKGGTQEHLEYSAVAAKLTEERCFELVDNYMK